MPESDPKYDRLKLSEQRIADIAGDIRKVAGLPSPLGTILEQRSLNNGLELKKISVPLGVIGIIYEARPNVTFDVFALCLKSGNACILKGGSDAEYSNVAIVELIREVIREFGIDENVIALLPADRQATTELLNAVGFVDIIIPRGSQSLIDFVRNNAKVPVIETGAGIVHTYVDKSADLDKSCDIIFNAKTRRVSVCNALDCLIIHEDRLSDLFAMVNRLKETNVIIYADAVAYKILRDHYPDQLLEPAQEEHFGTEFLDYKMAVKTVGSLREALDHIAKYSSKHSEAIIAEDEVVIDQFLKSVDAAAVYANTSTAFTDGAQFGLGAEIGISTQKLHARGPMALREMTSYKWIIKGSGQVRA
ncbi:MAG: glutamate-5-semialdehyde dehydrogenase [Cyclobacteriaceae bacterium]|nr:glutamate-5-semialdehyde dehydrogenase [Cyclobacteriaceae bacterium]